MAIYEGDYRLRICFLNESDLYASHEHCGLLSSESLLSAMILTNKSQSPGNGFTNVPALVAGSSQPAKPHENGLNIQSRQFGLDYPPGIAIPSIVRAFFWNRSNTNTPYESFYTESNASPESQVTHDSGLLAASNILKEGKRIIGAELSKNTLRGPNKTFEKKYRSMKSEVRLS